MLRVVIGYHPIEVVVGVEERGIKTCYAVHAQQGGGNYKQEYNARGKAVEKESNVAPYHIR
jgi:hypothetical protein